MAEISDERIDYKSNDPIMRLRVIHENLMEHELSGTAGNLWKVITELQARRAAEAKAVEALPPGRSKQDVANLVDAAIQDSLVELDDLGGHRYDYDIMQEKLRANGLTIAALGASQ